MRIQLHGLAHNVGALLARTIKQAHLVHGVKEFAVRGLKAVNLGECARDVGAHGVGHVVGLERVGDGLLDHLGVQSNHVGGVYLLLLVLLLGFLCHVFPLICTPHASSRAAY